MGAFSYDNGPPVLNENVDVLLYSEKDDVEGDDVKRGSETGANLNMAVSRRGPTAYLSQYRTWVPRPEKNAHLPRTPLSLMAQTYGRVLEGCVFL